MNLIQVHAVDAVDAAGRRVVNTRFVPVKTAGQQGIMSLHRILEGLKEERTACVNRIRGVLAELGSSERSLAWNRMAASSMGSRTCSMRE